MENLDKCVKWIKGKGMTEFVKKFLEKDVPSYFWEVPASSTGKYHPKFAKEEGGLVRHTRVAVNNALSLFELDQYAFSAQDEDIILVALILHDTFKHGKKKQKYSVANHGVICAEIIEKDDFLPNEIKFRLAGAVASHMGQWNKDYKTKKIIAPEPQSELEKFVHLCDYLASKKYLEVNFKEVKT